jgi:hypothetical protein
VVSTRGAVAPTIRVVPDQSPWPTDSPSTAARLAVVIDSIDMRDQKESDSLLIDFLRTCWPTVWTQDQ